MVFEARKQSMAWMETDYSKHTHFRWKIKWRLEHLGALGIMGEKLAHEQAKPQNCKQTLQRPARRRVAGRPSHPSKQNMKGKN